jgi:FdhD protein
MARAEQVEEVTVWIDVNGVRTVRTSATPDRIDALVIGRLATDGFIARASEAGGIDAVDSPPGCLGVQARVDAAAAARAQARLAHVDQHGCGALGSVTCEPARRRHADTVPTPDPTTVPALLRALTAAEQAARGAVGGMHGCGVVTAGELREAVFDVGRHGALDKAVGAALLTGLAPYEFGLVTTARISGEMAAKAARIGVAWLASRSLATSLALDVAAAAGLPLIERAGSSAPRLHESANRDARLT